MGLLDSLTGALGGVGGSSGGGQGDLLNAVIAMLGPNAPGGGLAGLVSRLQQGGLGEAVNSWISTGPNLPVSADQLSGALGAETLGPLAQQLGLSHGDLAQQLARLLPQVVDRLTPQGQLPAGGVGGDLGGLLGGLLGR